MFSQFSLCDQSQDVINNLQDALKKLNETDPEEIKQNLLSEEEEFSKELIEEMGIKNMEVITKDTFREYITRMINTATEDEKNENEVSPDEEEFFNYLIEEIMKEIPEKMNQEEFTIFSNTDRYKSIVERIMQEKFGDNYTDEIIQMMSGSFENLSNSDLSETDDIEELMRKYKGNKDKDNNNDDSNSDDEIEIDNLENLKSTKESEVKTNQNTNQNNNVDNEDKKLPENNSVINSEDEKTDL